MPQKIYIGKLSPTTDNQQLFDHFSKIGEVISAKVMTGIDGKTNAGYGYVVMGSDKTTEEAIKKLDNSNLQGKRIRVIKAHYMDQSHSYTYRRYGYKR